jgi:phosphoglycerate dehydrogenase-like enzyme
MSLGARRPQVGLAANELVRRRYLDDADLARLGTVADFTYRAYAVTADSDLPAPRDTAAEADLGEFAAGLDALIICHGSPYVSDAVLEGASHLSLLGELEGDRFARRLDLAAAQRRGVRVVDTSNGSSWPTAEWALGLALVGRRNAGALFRRMISHEPTYLPAAERSGLGYDAAELTGKRVGMIGFGHVARRLVELLRPFRVEIQVFDPYAARELAEAYGVAFGPLASVLEADVVFVLVPQTSSTEGMLARDELARLRPGSVFVNVSRGKVVDADALLDRLRQGDVIACLDVFDPEPLPLDSTLVDLPNVFCTPHIAGVTEESRRRFFSLMVDECLRHFAGLGVRYELTAEVVDRRG